MLEEQEELLARIEAEKPGIESALATGEQLLRDRSAPDFLADTVSDVADRLGTTQQMVKDNVDKLKVRRLGWGDREVTSMLEYCSYV